MQSSGVGGRVLDRGGRRARADFETAGFGFSGSRTEIKMGPTFAILTIALLDSTILDLCEGLSRQEKEVEILDGILKNYDTRIRPYRVNISDDNAPTIVRVYTNVRSMKVDDINMEVSVQLTFRQSWVDERLQYSASNSGVRYLMINDPTKIWVPGIFFSNEIQGFVHDLITPNIYIRIYPDGTVMYSARLSMTLACPMNLRWFPFDEQECSVRMASYGYTDDNLVFLWKEVDPVEVSNQVQIRRFKLVSYGPDYCSTRSGAYSCLKMTLRLQREHSYYILNVLIPSAMLVIVSWISFWLDHSAIMGRVLIGVTTLLSLALKPAAFNLAPVSYTKSIDVWTGVCLTFIFVALLESAIVNYMARSEEKKRPKKCGANDTVCTVNGGGEEELDLKPLMTPNTEAPQEGNGRQHTLTLKERACAYTKWVTSIPTCSKRLDIICRIVFPVSFTAFVVVYALANAFHCNDQ